MIISRLDGGMGNQMFQYAVARHLAIKNNVPLGLYLDYLLDKNRQCTTRNYDLDIYNVQAEIINRSEIPRIYRYYNNDIINFFPRLYKFIIKKLKINNAPIVDSYLGFDESILSLGPDVFLDGGWQSEKYFKDISDVIRKDFELKNPPSANIQNLLEVIKSEDTLCLHVRRGDYIGDNNFELVGKDYYARALDYIKSKVSIDKIYIFSDDIKWCEENLKFDLPSMFIGDDFSGLKAEGHHILMRACKYFIIPNSTYAWWAAWLSVRSGKIVATPNHWFPKGSLFENKCADIVPEDWVRI